MAKESKSFVLRIDGKMMEAIEKWDENHALRAFQFGKIS
jgi:hypothetical protein